MKAMLYADWMNFRQSLRTIVLIMAFCLVWTAATGEFIVFSTMLVVTSYLFPNTVFNVERTSGWDKLSLSMPVLRRDVVASRFLLSLAVNAAMLACGLVFFAAANMIWDTGSTFEAGVSIALATEPVVLLLLGLQLTAAFKWDIQKAGYVMMGFFVLFLLAMFSMFQFVIRYFKLPYVSAWVQWLVELEGAPFVLLLFGCVLAALAVYAICYLISVRVYRKKEL